MATDTHRFFDLPRGGRFRLLANWWVEAGMDDIRCEAEAYLIPVYPPAELIALTDIEPPPLQGRAHLTDNGFDEDRMVSVLRGIANHPSGRSDG